MDALLTWLSENYPDVFGVLLLLGTGATVGILMYKYHHRIKDVEEKCDDIHDIKNNVQKIISILVLDKPKTATIFSIKHSPRQLNKNGEKLFEIIRGNEFFDENGDTLLNKLYSKNIISALDAERGAREVLFESIDEPQFKQIKDIVYNHPSIDIITPEGGNDKYEFTLNDAIFVLSLRLRDMFLECHPEITTTEGDH